GAELTISTAFLICSPRQATHAATGANKSAAAGNKRRSRKIDADRCQLGLDHVDYRVYYRYLFQRLDKQLTSIVNFVPTGWNPEIWNSGSFRSFALTFQIRLEPLTSKPSYLVKRSRFFEQVGRTFNNLQLVFASELIHSVTIEIQNRVVFTAHNKQSGCAHTAKRRSGQIRTPAA